MSSFSIWQSLALVVAVLLALWLLLALVDKRAGVMLGQLCSWLYRLPPYQAALLIVIATIVLLRLLLPPIWFLAAALFVAADGALCLVLLCLYRKSTSDEHQDK